MSNSVDVFSAVSMISIHTLFYLSSLILISIDLNTFFFFSCCSLCLSLFFFSHDLLQCSLLSFFRFVLNYMTARCYR
ncbi:hypothetical protein I7I48_02011 [Histoplasma ohiense]|nr:hypothetical protein I7I48_02011 [Histoplasma ohiense (nom. inval.)]